MKSLRSCLTILFACFILISCNEHEQNIEEKNRVIRQRFDSIGRELDSINRKLQRGADSALHDIDSLLKELDNKKSKNK